MILCKNNLIMQVATIALRVVRFITHKYDKYTVNRFSYHKNCMGYPLHMFVSFTTCFTNPQTFHDATAYMNLHEAIVTRCKAFCALYHTLSQANNFHYDETIRMHFSVRPAITVSLFNGLLHY